MRAKIVRGAMAVLLALVVLGAHHQSQSASPTRTSAADGSVWDSYRSRG